MQGKLSLAMLCLMMSGFCDMFDGTVAKTRKRTRQEKNFGIQIDSLADLVCFGVLPVVIGYNLGLNTQPYHYLILVVFTLAALIRLAYFNVCEEERQATTTEPRKYYEGLPVTCDALILPALYSFRNYVPVDFTILYGIALVAIAVAFVTKFKLVKLKMRGMLGLLLVGILVFIWFIKEF
ncbi:CDP-diacylglycerol--serine O-phosphatidyltransferase [Lachnospiraceae bacterium KM106-2]|nr:CDP-diacylglycerol--serine O-phosphatidyltransferase [Lachnospiraceae bacterium KM106-2]